MGVLSKCSPLTRKKKYLVHENIMQDPASQLHFRRPEHPSVPGVSFVGKYHRKKFRSLHEEARHSRRLFAFLVLALFRSRVVLRRSYRSQPPFLFGLVVNTCLSIPQHTTFSSSVLFKWEIHMEAYHVIQKVTTKIVGSYKVVTQ